MENPKHPPNDLIQLATVFGLNSNSFMTLYPGFRYFQSSRTTVQGKIAYLQQSHCWVGAAEPLSSPEHQADLLVEFSEAAAKAGKSALLLPVGTDLATKAAAVGYGSLLIGIEPSFDLRNYPKTGSTWVNVVPTAKTLDSKHARVLEIDPATCSQALRDQLNAIASEWLNSRKMPPLGFLNKVEPWTLQQYKRYFIIELDARIYAFLAAIPIWPRQGWYLVDLLRRNHAPAGTTELLTLHAMRILKEQGAQEISLGVSPLAGVDHPELYSLAMNAEHPFLYPFLRHLYLHGGIYNCDSLYQYKLKFKPDRLEPAFLIYKDVRRERKGKKQRLSLPQSINVFQSFSQRGLAHAIFSGLYRSFQKFNIAQFLQNQVRKSIIVRSMPRTWTQLFYRCKFTVGIALGNLVIFLLTSNQFGMLRPNIEKHWGYSWNSFLDSPVRALLLSPFLHWNLLHLTFNLISLLGLTGSLECLAGSGITATCYVVSMVLSNPLTSYLLLGLGLGQNDSDVGASLGIFGCGGALFWFFLKNRGFWVSMIFLAVLLNALVFQSWMVLNHAVAMIIGIHITGLILP